MDDARGAVWMNEACKCPHSELFAQSGRSEGLALVTIGSSLRGDDGVGEALTLGFGEEVKGAVCCFNLGLMTAYLAQSLAGHSSAVIIDAVHATAVPSCGQVHLVNLSDYFAEARGATRKVDIDSPLLMIETASSHGISWLEELRLACGRDHFPGQVYFFGVEVLSVDAGQGLSAELAAQLPCVKAQLNALLSNLLSR